MSVRLLQLVLALSLLLPSPVSPLPAQDSQPQEKPAGTAEKPAEGPPAPPEATAEPTLEQRLKTVQEKIKEVEASAELDGELKKKVIDAYREAETKLQQAQKDHALAEAYKKAIEEAPKQVKEIRARIEGYTKTQTPETKPQVDVAPGDTSKELTTRLEGKRGELEAARGDLKRKDATIADLQTREGQIQQEEEKAVALLKEIETALASAPPEGESALLTAARKAQLQASRIAATEQIARLKQERLSLPMRLDRAKAEREELAKLKIARLEAEVKRYEELVNEALAAETKQQQLEAERARREAAGKHPLIKKLADRNVELAKEQRDVVKLKDEATRDKQLKDDQKKQYTAIFERFKTKLEKPGVSGVGGAVLRDTRKRLPRLLQENAAVASKWNGKIPAAESRQFEVDERQYRLANLDQAVEEELLKEGLLLKETTEAGVERVVPKPGEPVQEITGEVKNLLSARKEIFKSLDENYEGYLTTLRELEKVQGDLETTARQLAALLDKHLLWIPSSGLPNAQTLTDLVASAQWLLAPESWTDTVGALGADFRDKPYFPALAALVLLPLLFTRRRMRRHLGGIAEKVGRPAEDRFSLTLQAIALTFLLVVPFPLALGFIAWRLVQVGSSSSTFGFALAVGTGLFAAAQLFLALRFFLVLCQQRGVAEVHFRWRDRTLKLVRRHLWWLFLVLLVSTFVCSMAEAQPNDEIDIQNSLGRLAFLIGMGGLAVFVQRVIRPKGGVAEELIRRQPDGWLSRLRYVWYPLAVGVPVTFAVVSVLGYYYTALQLENRVTMTAGLVIGVVIVYNLALRWLIVEQRRLAIEQAREKREAAQAAEAKGVGPGEAPAPAVEIPEVNLSTINEQTRRLLRTLVGIAIVLGLWFIWSSVLPALSILDQVQLWPTEVAAPGSETGTITEWVTLENVALSLIALILTAAAAKNLPGVLEIAVLKNLPLEPAVRYAITTISQYVLTGVGIVVAFNIIGIGWSNVQWLIAALSVGIGFGLQEIVANFICGIILLFERPIRVGDIVKVGDVMGLVSKIRIRATTITDWDRMDYIVPNKELITGRLLNWTLSSTVNRVVINVGVAYGSDTERARELLLKVAAEHPLVMDDPGALATFEGFGNSTLNLVLRCYLPDFANRLATIHELHSAIDKAFKEAGIEIAFPQIDVHFKSGSAGAPPAALEHQPASLEPSER